MPYLWWTVYTHEEKMDKYKVNQKSANILHLSFLNYQISANSSRNYRRANYQSTFKKD